MSRVARSVVSVVMFLVYGINRFASAELVYRFLFLVVARPLVSLSGLSSTIHAPRRPSRRRSRHDLGARTIDRGTLLKLLDLIRQLGPLDTWFYFLKVKALGVGRSGRTGEKCGHESTQTWEDEPCHSKVLVSGCAKSFAYIRMKFESIGALPEGNNQWTWNDLGHYIYIYIIRISRT